MNKPTCPVCDQKMDLYTTAHKSHPFVDGRVYPSMCFTCFFVPRVVRQTYDSNGLVVDEIDVPYSCDDLCTPKELHDSGASDTLKQAKSSVEAVVGKCRRGLKAKGKPSRPKASWSIPRTN